MTNPRILAKLLLATYCVQYQHAVPFLRNKVPYPLLKPPKTYANFFGGDVAF